MTIDETFQKYFASVGKEIRAEQRAVITSVLEGNNTLSLMPTGGGKSLCYWIAGLALGGTTLVVFPLTALMDEQALKLRSHGLAVAVLHSGIPARDQHKQLMELYHGQLPHFVFASPERLATDGFLEFVLRQRTKSIKLVVIDEIHCISQWGHDFRPFYKEIPPFLNATFGEFSQWPTILGLTATLNQKDTEQICRDFHIEASNALKSQYLLRYPIQLRVVKVDDEPEKDHLFWEELDRHRSEKVLVYIDNRRTGDRSTEGLADRAKKEGYATAYFHGSMSSEDKADVIQRFKSGELLTVFATSAFGMGIDIPDIRGVIHYRPPESIEQYYQQIGRVGRDGKLAWALIYYSEKNINFRKSFFIDKSFPDEEKIRKAFQELSKGSGRLKTFDYFAEEDAQSAFHYLLRSEAINLRCKGIQKIDVFSKASGVALPQFDEYRKSTRTGLTVLAAEKTGVRVETLVQDIYRWLVERKIKPDRSPHKALIVEQLLEELPEAKIAEILSDAKGKQDYRYDLLDELVGVLEGFTNSINMHQDIGRYLGVDKFQMGRVHQTVSGIMVRSKSEVIIANLLTDHRIPFEYEQRLEAGGYGFWPDFTIAAGNRTFYWEHLGRLDLEQYRQNWDIKRQWYDEHFPGQLITTEESSVLSQMALAIITQRFAVTSSSNPDSDIEHVKIETANNVPMVNAEKSETSPLRVQVFTEGQTDWKHMKAAFLRLRSAGMFPHLDIKFHEDETDIGDQVLLDMCKALSRAEKAVTTVCVFDRDRAPTLRQVVDEEKSYKYWGNSVYSLALPVPAHRRVTPDVCIEFYYQDDEIKQEDERGRRLFIGTEFNNRTMRHISEPLVCGERNKLGRFTIIDQQVYRTLGDTDDNVALSKNDFARNVLNRVQNFDDFDLSAFSILFDLIAQIAQSDSAV